MVIFSTFWQQSCSNNLHMTVCVTCAKSCWPWKMLASMKTMNSGILGRDGMSIPSTFTLNFLLQSHMEMVNTRSWSFSSMVNCSWVPDKGKSGRENYSHWKKDCVCLDHTVSKENLELIHHQEHTQSNKHFSWFTCDSGAVVHLCPVLLLNLIQLGIRWRLQNQVDFLPVLQTLTDPVEVVQWFLPVQVLLPAWTNT